MPTHGDFLQAILADPDDDTPRLIYADWLEEQGDPRGEFIRVQCEAAATRYDDLKWYALIDRQCRLLGRHRKQWGAELPELEGMHWRAFNRGFMAGIGFRDFEVFQKAWPIVKQITPIQSLYVGTEFHSTEIQRLMAWPDFHRIRGLAIGQRRHVAEQLAKDENLRQVRNLDLSENFIGNADIKIITDSGHVTGLTHLLLHDNDIGNPGASILAVSPSLQNLIYLDLSRNRMSAVGARDFVLSPYLQNIQFLDLRNNDIVEPGLSQLRERFGARVRLGSQ